MHLYPFYHRHAPKHPVLDMQESKYTITVDEMKRLYDVDLNFDGVPFVLGHDEEIKQAIIDYFMFREIGFESIGIFQHHFNAKLRRIMPVFNKLYELDEAMGDYAKWFENADYTVTQDTVDTGDETFTRSEDGSEEETGKDTGTTGTVTHSEGVQDTEKDRLIEATDTTTSVTDASANTKKTMSGSDTATIDGSSSESGNTGKTDSNTRVIDTGTTENERLFKVMSNLPQDMVRRNDIEANLWASAAAKEDNTTTGTVDSTITDNGSSNITHGKKVDTDQSKTMSYGNVTDNEAESHSETHDLTRIHNETKDTGKVTSSADATQNLNSVLDLVRNTSMTHGLNDERNTQVIGNLQRRVKGNIGRKYIIELVPLFREAILNIPQMIINEMEPLFMGVW